jgi:enoyl-[acyl-carrier-protein] reductase (NADH)
MTDSVYKQALDAARLIIEDLALDGIGAGETKTNLKYWKDNSTEDLWKELSKKNPLGRVGTPEDVASVAQMIVEDTTKFLNGNIIYINGGNHL